MLHKKGQYLHHRGPSTVAAQSCFRAVTLDHVLTYPYVPPTSPSTLYTQGQHSATICRCLERMLTYGLPSGLGPLLIAAGSVCKACIRLCSRYTSWWGPNSMFWKAKKFGSSLRGRGLISLPKRCRPVNLESYASTFLTLGKSLSRR